MRLDWFTVLAVALCGCRADVAGMWEGNIGGEQASLSLDQKGSLISGTVCFSALCDSVDDGVLEESSVVLTYGCHGCALPKATLDLVLQRELAGEQHLWACECTAVEVDEDTCMCRSNVSFARCSGDCGGAP